MQRPGTARSEMSRAATTRPLNRPWTRRRNGSSNRKKLMSLPKIGSVTGVAGSGENGTWWAHSSTVCQAPPTEAPIVMRDEDRQAHQARRRPAATGRATPRYRRRRQAAGRTHHDHPRTASRTATPGLASLRGGLVDAVDEAAQRSGTALHGRWRQPACQPEIAEQHDRGTGGRPRRTGRGSPSAGSRRSNRSRRSCTRARPSRGRSRPRTG